jgi:hypothetical protein
LSICDQSQVKEGPQWVAIAIMGQCYGGRTDGDPRWNVVGPSGATQCSTLLSV